MKRTGELVFGIIGSLFNLIAISFVGLLVVSMSSVSVNEQFQNELVTEMEKNYANNPNLQDIDPQSFADTVVAFTDGFGPFGWFFIVCFVISLVLGIVACIQAYKAKNKKANMAGWLFIVAAIFAGIISFTSFAYYIAAIICFVRKPKTENQTLVN